MDNSNLAILNKYDYSIPSGRIAIKPKNPRDAANLLIFNRHQKKINYSTFHNIADFLPKNAVLVFNQTKVWPARLLCEKATGGKVEVLYVQNDHRYIKALANKHLLPGQTITITGSGSKTENLTVIKKSAQFYFLKPSFSISQIGSILKKYGHTPLPPYIKNSPLTETQRREQYQTVFAKSGLSIAAPTASLHFTKKLMADLQKQGKTIKFLRLDVGMGTFAPLHEDNLKTGKLHEEFFKIDKVTAEFLNNAKKHGRPIIAVGTTVVRTLESAAKNNHLNRLHGGTDLFIKEGYEFQFVDGIITNFHVPKSSLLMLVSAFAGRKTILELYKRAIKKRFRFFSFGDGMLIL